ncbi:Ent-kaurene synthase [Madurella fahalii]|uniref:Ent-kaurene synthase n=1 Tax=Madurella fahalii TaxID=1157608 RepID=A0ABQ0FWM8_9PEZI
MVAYTATDKLNHEARRLIQKAVGQYHEKYGFGSMSCAVYDTAWVSMVAKTTQADDDGPRKEWLFPESLLYLIKTQSEDGSWDSVGCATPVDSILNTAASLLALKRHLDEPLQLHDLCTQHKLKSRVESAAQALRIRLQDWDVAGTNSVGFEIIVPSILELLQDEGLTFDFAGKKDLMAIRAAKLSRFKPEYLYAQQCTTAVHSLEAFVGKVDFDRVSHHCSRGSMMGSPSSTAAYLMYASHWDENAEDYLRHLVCGLGDRDGGVPSAYPSTYFEYIWMLSTLLRAGFTDRDLACPALNRMTDILAKAFSEEGGTLGFAPRVGEDVDDTAKGVMCLAILLQKQGKLADTMVEHFETESHFKTYASERDPSFSANCNVLLALLHQRDAPRYTTQIVKAARFLSNYWWHTHGHIRDKWNLSPLYNYMLLAQAFTDLLSAVDKGLIKLGDDHLLSSISITLVQCCLRVMLSQSSNGSWNDSREQTSYGIAVLSEALRLSCFRDLHGQLNKATDAAVEFLEAADYASSDYIWIEKVTYSSPFLTQSYRLAALKSAMQSVSRNHSVGFGAKPMQKYVGLFRQMPLFSGVPDWQLQASSIESSLFLPLLRARRLDIFPRHGMEKDKYFDMIPFIWSACNNYSQSFASTAYIYEMMVVSLLNFQADEHMEAVAGTYFKRDTGSLRCLIDEICLGDARFESAADIDIPAEVHGPLRRFVSTLLQHPGVLNASVWDQQRLRHELRTYLQAHVSQTEDSGRLQRCGKYNPVRPGDTFARWVRTTSADHTSGPYAFAFVSCLLSSGYGYKPGGLKCGECFPTASQKYFADCWCRHLATMCRMYNDVGSVARDAAEGNLNSLDFPEFAAANNLAEKKKELLALAEYERDCLDEAQRRLEREILKGPSEVSKAKLAVWRVFRDVTDLHGQIYVTSFAEIKATGIVQSKTRACSATFKNSLASHNKSDKLRLPRNKMRKGKTMGHSLLCATEAPGAERNEAQRF